MSPGKTFVKITNKDIFDKVCDIESHVKETNGKVNLNRWIATTALSIAIISIGYIVRILSNKGG